MISLIHLFFFSPDTLFFLREVRLLFEAGHCDKIVRSIIGNRSDVVAVHKKAVFNCCEMSNNYGRCLDFPTGKAKEMIN